MYITYKNFITKAFIFIVLTLSSFFAVKYLMSGHDYSYDVSIKMQSGHIIDTTLTFTGGLGEELILSRGCIMRNHKKAGIICGVESFNIKK